MVVWVIGRNYPLPGNGMQGAFEWEQAKMLSRRGNEVHYLTCALHPTRRIKGQTGFRSWKEDGVSVSVLSVCFAPRVYPVYFVEGRNRRWKSLFREVERRNGTPDVIHVHYPAMLMIAGALEEYREKGVRIVATEHWTKVLNRALDPIEMREFRRSAEIADRMICVGSPLARSVRELTGKEAAVIPNVVSDLFKPAGKKQDGFRFVSVGRLAKLKRFDIIINAFLECFAGDEDVSLTIIGDGEERRALEELVSERDPAGQIRLTGIRTREQTAEILSSADSLICFSDYETFGVPVIEAWACGIPAIATNTTAVFVDHYDERLGIRVSPKDEEELKQALRDMLSDHDRYDGEFIASYARKHFSEEAVYGLLAEAYADR